MKVASTVFIVILVGLIVIGIGLSAIEYWLIRTTGQSTHVIGGFGIYIIIFGVIGLLFRLRRWWKLRKEFKLN